MRVTLLAEYVTHSCLAGFHRICGSEVGVCSNSFVLGSLCWLFPYKNNSLLVYEGSQKLHEEYFKSRGLEIDSKNWQLIEHTNLESIKDKKILLEIPAGSFV